MSHTGISWPIVKTLLKFIRKFSFSLEPPEQKYLLVDEPIEEIRRVLGQNHFDKAWELSYNYYGEDINMRQPLYDESDSRPWKQLHVRGFRLEDGSFKLISHIEYEPTEYPDAHLHKENVSIDGGLYNMKQILDKSDITYREINDA